MILRIVFFSIILILQSYSQDKGKNLDSLTFDDLMEIEVVSFDGTPKKWKKTPAAIHVISSSEIEKSSAPLSARPSKRNSGNACRPD